MGFISIFGIVLMCVGALVTVLFWVPKVVNRPKLKEILGNRYPVVYMVYIANGPMLLVLGILLFMLFNPENSLH